MKNKRLKRGLAVIGNMRLSKKELRSLYKEIDKDKSGEISYKEWAKWSSMMGLRPRATFKKIDKNKSNSVSVNELVDFFWGGD